MSLIARFGALCKPSAVGKTLLHSLFVRFVKQIEDMLRMFFPARMKQLSQHAALMRAKLPNSDSDHHFLRTSSHQIQIGWVLTPKL